MMFLSKSAIEQTFGQNSGLTVVIYCNIDL